MYSTHNVVTAIDNIDKLHTYLLHYNTMLAGRVLIVVACLPVSPAVCHIKSVFAAVAMALVRDSP